MSIFEGWFGGKKEDSSGKLSPEQEIEKLSKEIANLKEERENVIDWAARDKSPADAGVIERLDRQIAEKEARLESLRMPEAA